MKEVLEGCKKSGKVPEEIKLLDELGFTSVRERALNRLKGESFIKSGSAFSHHPR